jgi:uncharacterized tellurite resistance protein B-like protein
VAVRVPAGRRSPTRGVFGTLAAALTLRRALAPLERAWQPITATPSLRARTSFSRAAAATVSRMPNFDRRAPAEPQATPGPEDNLSAEIDAMTAGIKAEIDSTQHAIETDFARRIVAARKNIPRGAAAGVIKALQAEKKAALAAAQKAGQLRLDAQRRALLERRRSSRPKAKPAG